MKKIFLLLPLLLVANLVFALEIPENVKIIEQYNRASALQFLQSTTFLVAFAAGVLSFLAPCGLPLIPAFFAYSAQSKKDITKMTFTFFLGFASVFTLMGLIAGYVGGSFVVIPYKEELTLLAGIFLVVLGVMHYFGKGLASPLQFTKQTKTNNFLDNFLFGTFFSVGWSACIGPILAGVLLVAAVLGNFIFSAIMLFFYSLGIFVPLFLLSFFFDKYNISKSKFFTGSAIRIISSLLLISLGIIFIIYRDTTVINNLDPFQTTVLISDIQQKLIGSTTANLFILVGLIVFIYLLRKFLKRK